MRRSSNTLQEINRLLLTHTTTVALWPSLVLLINHTAGWQVTMERCTSVYVSLQLINATGKTIRARANDRTISKL